MAATPIPTPVFARRVPRWPLSDFIHLLWLFDGPPRPHEKERLLPDGSVELIINLRDDQLRVYDRTDHERFRSFRGALISGPQSEHFVIDTAEQVSVAGVHFKAGGAFPFLKMPAREVCGQHVALEDLWGPAAMELRDRLLAAPTQEEKFRVMEECLLAQARRLERHGAVGYALREFHADHGMGRISRVLDRTGISQRRFIEVFRDEVGLAPKLFCRVLRFQEVLRRIATGGPVDWADLAADCGYSDQPHFIHDFREFSGINPSTYLVSRTEHLNHVPIR